MDYPFTAQGFTSGNNGRLSVPEWHPQNRIDIQEGTEIWKITRDGRQTLYAVFENKTETSAKVFLHLKATIDNQ